MIFIITTSLTLRICFDLTVTAPNLCRGKGKFSPCPLRLLHKKSPLHCCKGLIEEGGDLLSHLVAVPSALTDLTSLFGMVRGEPRRHGHLSFTSPTDPVAGFPTLRSLQTIPISRDQYPDIWNRKPELFFEELQTLIRIALVKSRFLQSK